MHVALRGTANDGGRCHQSIGPTVSDAIVRRCLWSTATRSSILGYFSNYYKQFFDPTFCGSRFSTDSLLAIEDFFTFIFYFQKTRIIYNVLNIEEINVCVILIQNTRRYSVEQAPIY